MIKIIKSATFGSVVFCIIVRYVIGNTSYPISIYILDWLLLIIFSGGSRLFIRVFREYVHSQPSGKKILIVGAGDAGEKIVKDIKHNPNSTYDPIGFIDEDPFKKDLTISGVPIFGQISSLPSVIENNRPDEILITLSSSDVNIKRIYELTKSFNIPIKKLPGINDILDGRITVAAKLGKRLIEANLVTEEKVHKALALQKKEGGMLGSKLVKLGYISEDKLISFLNTQIGIAQMKPISLEDLLQREPVRTDIKSVRDYIENKSVLVTGAAGSIGSELCRQIVEYCPSSLIMLDRHENGLFGIDLEFKAEFNNGNSQSTVIPVVADVTDHTTMEHVFLKYKPQIIFHAAAYKHVPMMEFNPIEAIKNNVFGTKNVIDAASRHNAESFVMISTDKAVNPTSIMGATKRVAEFLTIRMNALSSTKYTAVRFGNVLGSNGSVVPTFKKQIKYGGPLTVTHPDIKRYFMLIPEAVQLVLSAASFGKGGEIFVLDMGGQIKVADLAENLIRLSGFVPNKEIKIEYTGLRPGEKLYEELFDISEKAIPTFHDKIRIAVPDAPSLSHMNEYISELEHIVENYTTHKIISTIQQIVPNFTNDGSILNTMQ
jgi:FlaA1/EpsC-like NDP-sugar epimerase